MDGGGLSPGARWAAQSLEPSPSPCTPWVSGHCGNGLPLWQHRSLGSDGQRGLQSQSLTGLGRGAFTACRHYVIRAGIILESRHQAEVCGSGWHSLRTLGSWRVSTLNPQKLF